MALEFVEHDGSYQSYDLAPVEQDDVLTESDIRVANAMIARMSPRVIADIYARVSTTANQPMVHYSLPETGALFGAP